MSRGAVGTAGVGRLAGWLAFTLAFGALSYAARFAGDGEPAGDVFYSWGFAVQGLVQSAVFVGVMLVLARGAPPREFFGFRRPASWPAAALGMVAVFLGVFLVSFVVDLFADPRAEQGLIPERWDASRAAPFVANALLVCIGAPITEELTFRGAGYALLSRFGTGAAIVVPALVWALAHGLVAGFFIIAAFGLGLGWLRARTDSLYPCLVLHAIFNSIALAAGVGASDD